MIILPGIQLCLSSASSPIGGTHLVGKPLVRESIELDMPKQAQSGLDDYKHARVAAAGVQLLHTGQDQSTPIWTCIMYACTNKESVRTCKPARGSNT